MSALPYYQREAAALGVEAKTVGQLIAGVLAEPTHDRLRLLSAALAALKLQTIRGSEADIQLLDLLAIVQVEREWLTSQGVPR